MTRGLKVVGLIALGLIALGIYAALGWLVAIILALFLWRNWWDVRARFVRYAPLLGALRPGVLGILSFVVLTVLWAALAGAATRGSLQPAGTSARIPTARATVPASAPTAVPSTPTSTPRPTETPRPPTPTPTPKPPTPTPVPVATATPAATRTPTATVATAYDLTARVSNPSPRQRTEVTVRARLTDGGLPVAGAPMRAVWRFSTTTSECTGSTGSDGIASCTRNIGAPTAGRRVDIAVTVTAPDGSSLTAATSFTPVP